ncbi:MAG: F0F1 ATP synthase subunit gamma [Thermodesulfobacteriota bacterium]|nr:F0F1 ATP synthase subunit gamma [Thermodesulfobacteriota bacterium]
MATLETLRRKIQTSNDLLSVVKTMKSLAAVNIRQYEAAAYAMNEYTSVIASGWYGFFHNQPHLQTRRKKAESVCLVLGSDQAMCGQFNEVIIEYALSSIEKESSDSAGHHFWSAGERIRSGMKDREIEAHFSLPSSMGAIADLMVDIVDRLVKVRKSRPVDKFIIFYNHLGRAATYEPGLDQILPLDPSWYEQHRREKWPTRCFPMLGIDPHLLFETLFYQHIFASISKAFTHSLASENAVRLGAMQAAEKNIIELEEKLQGRFRETRQNAITEELLDIISGFEVINDSQSPVHDRLHMSGQIETLKGGR